MVLKGKRRGGGRRISLSLIEFNKTPSTHARLVGIKQVSRERKPEGLNPGLSIKRRCLSVHVCEDQTGRLAIIRKAFDVDFFFIEFICFSFVFLTVFY